MYYEQRRGRLNEANKGDIDPTDVPAVSVRELATALKVLADEIAALAGATEWSDEDFRRVEHFFWQRCGRERHRKTATLVRLRSLVGVSRARLLQALIAQHGVLGVLCLLDVAANMRLNARVGFSPVKLSCAVMTALKKNRAPDGLALGVVAEGVGADRGLSAPITDEILLSSSR